MASGKRTFGGMILATFKWLFAIIIVIVALVLLVWGGVAAYQYLTHGRYEHKVTVNVAVHQRDTDQLCSGEDNELYPLFVWVENGSSKTIAKTRFRLEARRKGYSTNLATNETYTDDKIIEPANGFGNCWYPPLPKSVSDDPRGLEWSVGHYEITFD